MHKQLHVLHITSLIAISFIGKSEPLPEENSSMDAGMTHAEHGKGNALWGDSSILRSRPSQVSQYIRKMFQDKKGAIWFGTNDKGVVRYDGESFTDFTVKEGLGGETVRGILEDADGNIWFATSGGVSRYDGKSKPDFALQQKMMGLFRKGVIKRSW